jgi:thioester reductase-like protein
LAKDHRTDFETKYSIELYPTDLFEYQTINALSKYFVEKYSIEITKYLTSQNNKQVEKPKLILSQFNFDKEKTIGHEVIFITGSTGILGAHVLCEILKYTKHYVICLVRSENIDKAWKRIGDATNHYDINAEQLTKYKERVSLIIGSIEKDFFGLPNEDYTKASDLTTAIYHCAADTDLFKPYEKLLSTNVTGTKNVIDYAHKTKNKKIFHISSWSVMGHKSGGPKSVFAEYNLDLNQEFPFGYQKAKAEAEKLFYENTNADLNWLILRVGNVFPDSRNMNFFYNEKGLNSYYLRLVQLMTSLECIYPLKFEFDITPVDFLSKTMIGLLNQNIINQTTLHVSSSDRKSTDFYFRLKRVFGMKIKIVNKNTFEELLRSKNIQTGDVLADKYLPLLIGHFDKMNHNRINYSNKLTQKKLSEIKILLPKFDVRYFIKLILKLVSIDYISMKSIKLNIFGKSILRIIDKNLFQEFLSLIDKIEIHKIEAIVVDGFVILDDEKKPGLGAFLYTRLEEKIPIIGTYFKDMEKVIFEMFRVLKSGRSAHINVSNSVIHETHVLVDEVFAEMGQRIGFSDVEIVVGAERIADVKPAKVKTRESIVIMRK